MLESQLQAKIIQYIKKNFNQKYFLLKVVNCNRPGFPDIALLSKERTICIEVKQLGKKPRPLQKFVMKQLEGVGVECYVVDSMEKLYEINL